MEIDLCLFDAMLYSLMENEAHEYSFEEVREIFHYYFERYEKWMGHPHPHIKLGQIREILSAIPFAIADDYAENVIYIMPVDYPFIIDLHFKTRYRNCDYNINHFFSGKIRAYRYFEAMAGYE